MSLPYEEAFSIELWFDVGEVGVNQKKEERSTHFVSCFRGKNRDRIFVDLPDDKALLGRLEPGTRLTLVVSREDGLYAYSTRVIGVIGESAGGLCLKLPRQVTHIQRRETFRWSAPVSVHIVSQDGRDMSGTTRNLSVGGMLVAVPQPLTEGEWVSLGLRLPSGELNLNGRVLRAERLTIPIEETTGTPRPWQLGIQFLDASHDQEIRITQFIHAEQRKYRRQGLL